MALCLAGCSGGSGSDRSAGDGAGAEGGAGAGSGGSGPGSACTALVSPLIKLSSRQYANAVRDLLQRSGAGFALTPASAALAALPADTDDRAFEQLDARISRNHINAYHAVAVAVADAIAGASVEEAGALAGGCVAEGDAAVDAACVREFVRTFGRRALRRVPSEAEVEAFATDSEAKSSRAALATAAYRLMLTPDFLYHLEVGSSEAEGQAKLSAFEVAARLAFHFWQTAPDDELLDAAQSGALDDNAGYAAQVDRLFADPRTRATVWSFYRQWFRLDRFPGFPQKEPFLSFAAGLGFATPGAGIYDLMVQEIEALAARVTWDLDGGMSDLLTSDESVTTAAVLAKIYGVAPRAGSAAPEHFAAGTRAGILTRAAFLVSGDETTSPFHRGAYVRREILCDELAQPDPATLPVGSLAPPVRDLSLTTQQRFAQKTESAGCMACHQYFNDIGYLLESYDSIGRFRSEERVFAPDGTVEATLPVTASGAPRITLDDDSVIEGPVALAEAVAKSGKADACFARQYFRFSKRRIETEADQCLIAGLTHALTARGGNLAAALRAVVFDPAWKTRRVTP